MNAFLKILPALAVVFICIRAGAEYDIRITGEFVAFSEDGSKFLVKFTDSNRGSYFSLRDAEEGKRIKDFKIDRATEEEDLVKLVKKHKLNDKGVEGQESPDGKYSLMGMQKKEKFRIFVLKGEKKAVFKDVELEPDGDVLPKASLKTVVWSEDGGMFVVVVNLKYGGGVGIEKEQFLPFEFNASEIKFK
ncbi:MAG: hypothetical protein FJ088_08945 [Deltaproteobacteria bacterium]|nr:hypothetical protein [Deltaproteobacteria bacterium]